MRQSEGLAPEADGEKLKFFFVHTQAIGHLKVVMV
jgi:hypothetical protein